MKRPAEGVLRPWEDWDVWFSYGFQDGKRIISRLV